MDKMDIDILIMESSTVSCLLKNVNHDKKLVSLFIRDLQSDTECQMFINIKELRLALDKIELDSSNEL